MRLRMMLFLMSVYFLSGLAAAYADPAILPGTACPGAGRVIQTGGAETGGNGNMMVCEGGTWKAFMSFDGTGQITRIGHQTCNNGQVLSYNGSRWVCGNKGQLQCNTVASANCPSGSVKTGYTPDLLLGIGSYPVCCRVQ